MLFRSNGLVKINGKQLSTAITGKDIDGSGEIYVSLTEASMIFNTASVSFRPSDFKIRTNKEMFETTNSDHKMNLLKEAVEVYNSKSLVYNPLRVDVVQMKGIYFVKLSCLVKMMEYAGKTAKIAEKDIMFRSSDWTAAKGEKAMRDAADNLLLSGTSIPSAWDSALYNYFGKVKFSYHLASDLFRREAAAKLRDMRSPGFVSQIGTLVSIYNITPLDVIVIADL